MPPSTPPTYLGAGQQRTMGKSSGHNIIHIKDKHTITEPPDRSDGASIDPSGSPTSNFWPCIFFVLIVLLAIFVTKLSKRSRAIGKEQDVELRDVRPRREPFDEAGEMEDGEAELEELVEDEEATERGSASGTSL